MVSIPDTQKANPANSVFGWPRRRFRRPLRPHPPPTFLSRGRNFWSPLLPMAMTAFRRSPARFARRTGEPRNVRRKFSSLISANQSSAGFTKSRPGLKLRRLRGRRFPVPGANILANVAAENMPPHPGAKFLILRKCPTLFDREVCDATVRVELIRRDECVGGTGVDAARAACHSDPGPARRSLRIRFEIE